MRLFVVTMLAEDGAAARDGRLEPGDRIVSVAPTEGGQFVTTRGLDQETVMHLLRGRIGTTVRLKVADATGANPREIELERGLIAVAGGRIWGAGALLIAATGFWLFDRGVPGNRPRPGWLRVWAVLLVVIAIAVLTLTLAAVRAG